MNYKENYSAANATEAHLIRGLLEQDAIETILSGEYLPIATGGFSGEVVQAGILVNEDKFSEAITIISKYEQTIKVSAQDGES